jgi:S1-C subfamily serine protease
VLFDDGKWYTGIITGKDPKTQLWVTKFEDGTEDFTTDPQNDKDYKLLD